MNRETMLKNLLETPSTSDELEEKVKRLESQIENMSQAAGGSRSVAAKDIMINRMRQERDDAVAQLQAQSTSRQPPEQARPEVGLKCPNELH